MLYLFFFPFNIFYLLIILIYLKIINKSNIICYSTTRHTHFYAYIAKFFIDIKIIAHVHSFEPVDSTRFKFNKFVLSKFDKIIFVSKFVSNLYNIENSYILYNPVKFSSHPIEQRNVKPVRVGFVGNFYKWKGVDTFIDMCFLLEDKINEGLVKCDLFGDGPLFKTLSERKYSFPINFHGYVDNLFIYNELDIILVPSIDNESCPMVILESISLNKIIITTNIGGQKELVDLYGGFLVEPNNPQMMSDIICKLIVNIKDYQQFKYHNIENLNYVDDFISKFYSLLDI